MKDRKISVVEQCQLLDLPRSSYYYEPQELDETTLQIMREIDEEYTRHPFLGKRRICQYLQDRGCNIGVKQTRALMKQMGLISVVPGPHTSKPHPEHKKYPYLLKGLEVKGSNQVWTTDITYIRLSRGFVYLTAVFDWFSRYVIAWELSTTLDTEFCIRCVEEALWYGCPEIMNSDQGSQYTSREYIETLEKHQIQISMDGRGRAYDNIMIERFWRTIKCGEVYLKEYTDVAVYRRNLSEYIRYYNEEHWHSTLNNTPMAVYTTKRSG